MSEPFWTLKLADCINFAILITTIVAIVYGPIKAVEITRKKDLERDAESRKRQILSILMRTRRMTVHPDHVGALNQIQLEFYDFPHVLNALRAYIGHLSESPPTPGNNLQNFFTRRTDLFFNLLHTMAVASGVPLDRHELERLAYLPYGWQTEQEQLDTLRSATLSVLKGDQPIFVARSSKQAAQQHPRDLYPPRPN